MNRDERNRMAKKLRSGHDLDVEDYFAVLAVAAGERLGLSDEELLTLRFAAELYERLLNSEREEDPILESARELVIGCEAQDERLAARVLRAARRIAFDRLPFQGEATDVTQALAAVQPLVQPVGT